MNVLTDDQWQKLIPALRARCPRLTEQDLEEAMGRVDLLTAKVQNRHWIDKVSARRAVFAALADAGVTP